MKRIHLKHQDAAGFTIVELMIATLVFAVILIVITVGIAHFTTEYYKGLNSSNTQNVANAALNTVSQAIQFSGDSVNVSVPGVVCVGNQQFSYNLGKQLETSTTGDQDTWALYQTTSTAGSSCAVSHTGGKELLSQNMRLASFSVCSVGGATCTSPSPTNEWKISLRVVYGDHDLVCSPSVTGSCTSTSAPLLTAAQLSSGDLTCDSWSGSQFCSVAALSTVVQKKVDSLTP